MSTFAIYTRRHYVFLQNVNTKKCICVWKGNYCSRLISCFEKKNSFNIHGDFIYRNATHIQCFLFMSSTAFSFWAEFANLSINRCIISVFLKIDKELSHMTVMWKVPSTFVFQLTRVYLHYEFFISRGISCF